MYTYPYSVSQTGTSRQHFDDLRVKGMNSVEVGYPGSHTSQFKEKKEMVSRAKGILESIMSLFL